MALNGISFLEPQFGSMGSYKLAELLQDFSLACGAEVLNHFAKTKISLSKLHPAR